jgi:uncharacterized membrane protein
MKAPWLSKTLWTNVILAAVAFFPVAQAWVTAHPLVTTEVFAVINFGLRLISKDQISLGD